MGALKEIYEMKGAGNSIQAIARELGISRNSVRKYMRASELPQPRLLPSQGSKLDPYAEYVDLRLSEGLENCVVLLRELRSQGCHGSYTSWVEYVRTQPVPSPTNRPISDVREREPANLTSPGFP